MYAKRPGQPIFLRKVNILPGNLLISTLKAKKYKKQNVRFFQKHPLMVMVEHYTTTTTVKFLGKGDYWILGLSILWEGKDKYIQGIGCMGSGVSGVTGLGQWGRQVAL